MYWVVQRKLENGKWENCPGLKCNFYTSISREFHSEFSVPHLSGDQVRDTLYTLNGEDMGDWGISFLSLRDFSDQLQGIEYEGSSKYRIDTEYEGTTFMLHVVENEEDQFQDTMETALGAINLFLDYPLDKDDYRIVVGFS
jgi:hypothetical protein